ncbi:peptide chain release factor N(5)-glutamine methyltransferase [bacterium]|nr:peptide chain release factor N(5)-glutamine methyltransferase [bacterium]
MFAECVSALNEAGIPNSTKEVELVFSDVLKLQIPQVYLHFQDALEQEDSERITGIIAERKKRIPLAYLLSKVEFYNVELRINRGVFVPRPETELLVENTISILKDINDLAAGKILELGTGSGAIACALAKDGAAEEIIATDISGEAITNATQNAELNGVEDRISFYQGHWFEPLRDLGIEGEVSIVVSNPPYIRRDDIPGLTPEVKDYDPQIALDGGPDGLKCIREIMSEAPVFLKSGGCLILEIGYDQRHELENLFEGNKHYDDIEFVKDYNGYDRICIFKRV